MVKKKSGNRYNFSKRKIATISLVVALLFLCSIVISAEIYTSEPNFCGSCHIMKKYFNSWKQSNHSSIKCVECHYSPGEQHTIKAKLKGLSQLFSYIGEREKEVKTKAWINDDSCIRDNCHPPGSYENKKIKFTKNINFIHNTHNKNPVEGQTLHCNTCHIHQSEDKHFNVPKTTCYLCHFKNSGFNEGRGKCTICHKLPKTSLQKQKKIGEKGITHQSLQKANVPCTSCHYELNRGNGDIKPESCLYCHDNKKVLSNVNDQKMMHENHVAKQIANCFNCHQPIEHSFMDKFIDPVLNNCQGCHPKHHSFQKQLLTGVEILNTKGNILEVFDKNTPGLMFGSKTNCIGCHNEFSNDKKGGEKVAKATGKSCAMCHTKRHKEMLKKWKNQIKDELEAAKEIEAEAWSAIKKANSIKSAKKISSAMALVIEGKKFTNIVEFGNGIHNKKFSIILLDKGINRFEDALDLLSEQ